MKSDIEYTPEMEKMVLEKHKYKISYDEKRSKWTTHISSGDNRKYIAIKNREDLIVRLYKYYFDIQESNILDKHKKDFSEYKQINIWNIKEASYLISPNGDIYSIRKNDWLSPQINDAYGNYKGQKYIPLETKDGVFKRFSVARLTLAMFKGLPPQEMKNPTVDHIDSDTFNNYYKNLRWVEAGDNSAIRRNRGIGEQNSRSKLTQEQVIQICNEFVRGGFSIPALAQKYGVADRTIRSIYKKQNWKYITAWYEFAPY